MRARRAIVVVMAALVMWTAVSFWMLATIGANVDGPIGTFVISHAPCLPLRTTAEPQLTQAEMDAVCNQPRPADFVIPVLGYLLIVGFGVVYATAGKRQGSADQ